MMSGSDESAMRTTTQPSGDALLTRRTLLGPAAIGGAIAREP
jgi:hypothetical protein